MLVKILLTLLGCWLSLTSFAQPGPFGGHLRFRLFDAQGRLVEPGRADYRCFPSWGPVESGPRGGWARKFSPEPDGYRRFDSSPSPHGGAVPPDFTINVVHGRDTMRIQGLQDFRVWSLQVDSIPFRPGRFRVPEAYVGLLNVRAAQGRISNLDWALFRPAAAPDRLTAERLVLRQTPAGELPDTLVPACSRLLARYTPATATTDVYLAAGADQPPQLLLGRLPGHPLTACSDWSLLVLVNGVLLRSEDEGASWRAYEVRDDALVRWRQDTIRLWNFAIEQLWTDGERVLVNGIRRRYDCCAAVLGIYQLHFDQDTTAPVVRRSYARARADVQAVLLRQEQQREATYRQNMRLTQRAAANQAFVRQRLLDASRLMQNSSYILPAAEWRRALNKGGPKSLRLYPERPILTLQGGRFQYNGSLWVTTGDTKERIPPADLTGSYTLTDSTITFQPQPGAADPRLPISFGLAFYPSGTYYYYCTDYFNNGQRLVTLERPIEYFTRQQYITLRLRK